MSLAKRSLVVVIAFVTCAGLFGSRAASFERTERPVGTDPSVFHEPGQLSGTAGAYSPRQQELIDFATGRFARFDLTLPDVTISFDDTDSKCFGYGGIYKPSVKEVVICRPSPSTMIHELAHAWLESTLSAEERETFLEARSLTSWAGAGEWVSHGAEHAAEILTWALMDVDITIRWIDTSTSGRVIESRRLFKIPNSSPEELFDAFLQLTGKRAVDRMADDSRGLVTTTVFSPEAARARTGGI